MQKYKVKVDVTAGYLVDVEAEDPEQAVRKVEALSKRQVQAGEFFVNLDQEISEVWDEEGETVLEV